MITKSDIRLRKLWLTPHTNPRVHFYEIVDAFKQEGTIFTSRDVSALFDLTYADARRRMMQLQKWNLAKVVSQARIPKKASTYAITSWGRRYLQNRAKREESTPVPTD